MENDVCVENAFLAEPLRVLTIRDVHDDDALWNFMKAQRFVERAEERDAERDEKGNIS